MILWMDIILGNGNGNGNRMSRCGSAARTFGNLSGTRRAIRHPRLQCFAKLPDGHLSCQSRNAVLDFSECDSVADGAQKLKMPPNGGLSRRQSLTRVKNMIEAVYFRLQGAISVG